MITALDGDTDNINRTTIYYSYSLSNPKKSAPNLGFVSLSAVEILLDVCLKP